MSTDYTRRSSSTEFLHPTVRERVGCLIQACRAEGMPFWIFETYRSPERQAKLYKKRPRVTRAKPWRSYHQYGLSVDITLRLEREVRGKTKLRWSWSTKGEHGQWWTRMHVLAREQGLRPISGEKPHVQIQGYAMKDLRRGLYPDGGDDPWVYNLNLTIDRWESRGRRGAPPPAEYDDDVSRPSVTACGLED